MDHVAIMNPMRRPGSHEVGMILLASAIGLDLGVLRSVVEKKRLGVLIELAAWISVPSINTIRV
jgi:hypothetical protein